MSKHGDIIKYIHSLKVGSKISVRGIAVELAVSEGTAYRAIKEADNLGIVTTIPRVGTVRIEKVEKKSIEALNYAEVVNIVDGTILGGKAGIYKTLNKFLIGAMTIDAMKRYINPGNLLIIGNREEAQRLALLNESAVLIAGGFGCSEGIKKLANEKCLPIISSTYDSFTIASMINKAISENMIKKDIILVEDIMVIKPDYIMSCNTVEDCRCYMQSTKKYRLPVVDSNMKVLGTVTYNEVADEASKREIISEIMNKEILTVTPKTTVAYAAHIMAWEDIELCPVIEDKILDGVITRQDVIKALQYASIQPQIGENVEDLILKNFQYEKNEDGMHFFGKIIPQMLDSVGTASWSSLNMLISTMGIMTLRHRNNVNISVDSISTYFMKPVQIDSEIEISTKIIDIDRNFCKVEVDMFDSEKKYISKGILSAKILKNF